ncbi:MAG: hypothetical protein QOD03_416 [Verrucomicrobiota bacterium]|jgi:hypothetical protein
MKIETVKRNEAEYIFIDSVTQDVAKMVHDLSASRQRFCIAEVPVGEAESIAAELEQAGYSCAATVVQTEAETILARNSIGAFLRLYCDPPLATKSL